MTYVGLPAGEQKLRAVELKYELLLRFLRELLTVWKKEQWNFKHFTYSDLIVPIKGPFQKSFVWSMNFL